MAVVNRVIHSYCLNEGYGTRVIPDGTITGAHFVKVQNSEVSYVQVTGIGDVGGKAFYDPTERGRKVLTLAVCFFDTTVVHQDHDSCWRLWWGARRQFKACAFLSSFRPPTKDCFVAALYVSSRTPTTWVRVSSDIVAYTGLGNPQGGLVFSNAFNGTYEQSHEWTSFISASECHHLPALS